MTVRALTALSGLSLVFLAVVHFGRLLFYSYLFSLAGPFRHRWLLFSPRGPLPGGHLSAGSVTLPSSPFFSLLSLGVSPIWVWLPPLSFAALPPLVLSAPVRAGGSGLLCFPFCLLVFLGLSYFAPGWFCAFCVFTVNCSSLRFPLLPVFLLLPLGSFVLRFCQWAFSLFLCPVTVCFSHLRKFFPSSSHHLLFLFHCFFLLLDFFNLALVSFLCGLLSLGHCFFFAFTPVSCRWFLDMYGRVLCHSSALALAPLRSFPPFFFFVCVAFPFFELFCTGL